MSYSNQTQENIQRLQENLRTLRELAGWSVAELGARVGVSKQTISNLETGKARMSLMQYLAIRTVLEKHLDANPENRILKESIYYLLDLDPKAVMSSEEYTELKNLICTVAAAAFGGITDSLLYEIYRRLVKTLPQVRQCHEQEHSEQREGEREHDI